MKNNVLSSFFYERLNHLGNVQVVVSDKRISVCDTELEVEYFKAEVLSAVDYYPFGMMMPDRQWYAGSDSGNYRFGFNGMEKDNERSGLGNSYFTEHRVLDPRLGRWLSIDPAQQLFPGLTPYNSLNNNPIAYVDPDGLWHRKTTGKGADKREHLAADKGDNMESLEKYFKKRRNRNRFTDEQKDLIRNEVEAYGQANATANNDVSGTRTPSYAGFDMNLSEKLNLSVNIHVGRSSLIGSDPDFQSLYYSKGGHVGVEFEGSVYHYYYNEPYDGKWNKLYSAQVYVTPVGGYIFGGDGDHSYANGDFDGDGVPDIKGADSYFTVYLTTGQYAKMRTRMGNYAANPTGVPQYGIFGKRCTSMANTMLRKSDVRVIFMSSFRTFHPHQYYNALKKKGYAETVVR